MIGPAQRKRIWWLVLVAGLVAAADLYSKYWLIYTYDIPHRAPVRVCEYFSLVMAWNTGVSFSMFANLGPWMPLALIGLAVVICAVLIRLCLASNRRWERAGYQLVIGGALANAYDRYQHGAVADFFYAHIGDLGWPAFNVADMAICTGVGLLLLMMLIKPARP